MSAFEYHGSVTVGNGESESESGVPFASGAIIRSVVDAGTNEQIHVDSQELVFIGNYSREADDLLIENGSGTFVFINYFANPSQPDLIAPNGAKITFKIASALAGPASPGQYAQAGSATGELLQIGEVLQLDGKATATHTNGVQKTLNVGDPVFQGDVLETGSDTSLGISFLDETVFSVSANAKMVLDELIYDPKEAEKSSMTFNLVEGTFVFAAGKIAPSGSMNIETPIATMGIRGTTPKVSVSTEFGTGEFALLPDPGTGKIGSYVLINRDTGQIIGRVNSVDKKWVVTSLSNEAVEIGKSTADLLEDNQAIDDIQTVFSISIGERSSLEGTATFQQVSVTSISALSDQADDAIVVTDTSTGGRQVGIIDNPNVDDPPVAVDDEFDTGEDTLITGRNVIDNPDPGTDFDPEGYPVAVQAVNGTPLDFSNGSVSILLPSGAILVIAPNGDFTYDPNNAYEFLGLNDQDIDSFKYTIVDAGGFTDTATVEIIHTGKNDQPAITQTATTVHSGAFTEDTDTGSVVSRTVLGNVTFSDTDASDTHTANAGIPTVTWNQDNGNQVSLAPVGTMAVTLSEDAPDTNPVLVFDATGNLVSRPAPIEGTANWQYSVTESDIDFLGVGETLTLVFPITITDDSGVGSGSGTNEPASVTQNVTITITGTNDVMVVGTTDLVGAVTEDVAVTSGDLTDTGTLAFDDVDLSDVHNASASFKTTTHGGGQLGTLTASVTTDTTIGTGTGTGTGGIITWDFAVATADVQFLGAGDTITETYTITFTDNEGDTQTRDVDVTITGTNDVMVVGTTDLVGAVTEDVAVTSGDLTDTGTLAFDDVDLSDVHNASASFKTTTHGGGQLGTLTASVTTDTTIGTGTGTGTGGIITWDFAVATADVQFLGAGDTITETYTITFTDNEGDTQTRDVDVTITGTNDVMVVGTTDLVGAVTEDVAVTSGDLTDTGTIAFDDVDLSDVHNASAAFKTTTHGGGQLGTLTASVTTDTTIGTGTGTGTGGIITWDFAVATADVQFLGAGDTITETYTITFTDNEGDTQTRDVDVTVTGTNDVMVVGATDLVGAVTEDVAVTSGDLTDTGTLAFDDVDLSDVHNASATFKTTTHGGGQLGTLTASVTTDTTIGTGTGTGTGGIITWDFAVATADVQFLGAGDTITETYTITFTDNEGDTQTRDVDVTITGTNDVMVVGTTDLVGAVTEDVAVTSGDLTDTGTLAFDDVDLSDVHNASASFKTTTHGGGQLGTLTASVTTDTTIGTGTGTGTGGIITWDFAVATADVQFLGAGDTITETYTITFTDNEGDTQTRDVDVTITGTNDVPELTTVLAGSVTEDANNTATEKVTGAISFTDVDVTDTHTVTASYNNDATWSAGIIPSAVLTALEAAFSVTNSEWTFEIAQTDLQGIGEGETTTLSFDVTVTDDSSAANNTDTQTVTITITGSNDAPELTVDSTGSITEDATTPDLSANGSVTINDIDGADTHTVTALLNGTPNWSGGSLSSAQITALTSGTFDVSTPGQWDYTISNSEVQFLAAGETIDVKFDVTVTDDSGAANNSDTETVTITINGVNDAPTVTTLADPVAINEGNTGITTNVEFVIANFFTASDVDSGETPSVDEGNVFITANTNSDTTNAAPFVVQGTGNGTKVVVETGNYDSLNAGETGIFDVTYNVVSGSDTVTESFTITINGHNDAPQVTAISAGAVTEDDAVQTIDLLAGGQTDIDSNTTLSATNISAQDNLGNAVVFTNNNDGTIDIDPNQFGVALNTGDSRTVTVSYDVSDGTTGTANTATLVVDGVDDFNIPTALDIVLINGPGSDLLYSNDGSGNFSSPVSLSTTVNHNSSRGGSTGDIDGDGDLDLLISYGFVGPSAVFVNDGNGNFAIGSNLGGTDHQDGELGDFDNDGDLDAILVATGATNGSGKTATVFLNDGSGNFASTGQNIGNAASRDVALGDFDQDGDLDAVITSLHSGTTSSTQIWWNNGSANFNSATVLAGAELSYTVSVGDVNGDGWLDIVTSTADNGTTSTSGDIHKLSLNNGDGTFAAAIAPFSQTNSAGGSAKLADLDNDGDLDVFQVFIDQAAAVWLNDGLGNFTSSGQSNLSFYGNRLELGDLDNDGDIDAVSTWTGGASVLWLNSGTGQFTANETVLAASTSSNPYRNVILGNFDNSAPVVSAGGTLNFQHGIGAQRIEPTLSATDVDTNDQMTGATVTIQGFTSGDGDLLSFVNQNGITGSYDNTTGILTLNGSTTAAQYQSALASVTYNTSDLPATAETRTIEWVLNDGDANSATVTSTINIPAINEVLGAVAFTGTNGNDVLTGSNLVDDINGLDGDDIVFGSNADDLLTGGAGSDVFVLSSGSTDTILDFDVLNDYIDIAGVVDPAFDPNNPDADLTFSMNGSTLVLNMDDGSGGTESVIFGGASPPSNGDNINVVFDPTAEALQVQVGLGII